MTEFAEDRVFARHRRRRGAVLIIGAGAVGGFLAEDLARIGISPLRLVDPKALRVENLIRHPLGAEYLGQPKASSLASKISLDFPLCDARGLDEDFLLSLPEDVQRRMVDMADVVVAATDTFACQQRVNQVCLEAEKPAVYPAVWVDPRVRDAEVCEILWVDPSRHTPCYECWVAFRQAEADAQAARGGRVDIKLLALTTAQVVMSLLDPTDQQIAVRDPNRTSMYIHGFTPTSEGIQRTFPTPGLRNLYVRVEFPRLPCPACGQDRASALRRTQATPRPRPRARPTASLTPDPAVPAAARPAASPRPTARPAPDSVQTRPSASSRNDDLGLRPLALALVVLGLLGWGVFAGVGALTSWAHSLTSNPPAPAMTVQSAAPSSPHRGWTSLASFPITFLADMTLACVQLNGPGAYARLIQASPPSYGIKCFKGGSEVPGPDLDMACPLLAQRDHYRSPLGQGWWSGNPERYDPNTSDQPWLRWRCYDRPVYRP